VNHFPLVSVLVRRPLSSLDFSHFSHSVLSQFGDDRELSESVFIHS